MARESEARPRGRSLLGLLLLLGSPAAAADALVPVARSEALRVVDRGEGPPVVLLPGALGTAFGYRRLIGPLVEAGFRTLVVEPLGSGESTHPEDADYSLTAQADRLRVLLDRMALERAVVVGQGLGVSIALRLAARHPDRVEGVVALDGGPAESACSPALRRALKLGPLVRLLGGSRWMRASVRKHLVSGSADPGWVTEEVLDGYLGPASRDFDETVEMYRRLARAREPETLRQRLPDVRCPVLLLVGSAPHGDGVQPEEIALMASRLKCFERRAVPGAGQFLAEEAPGAVVTAVRNVLADARAADRVATGGGNDALGR